MSERSADPSVCCMIVVWCLSSMLGEIGEYFAVRSCCGAYCTFEFDRVSEVFIVFRCSENFFACRDSIGEPNEYVELSRFLPPSEFCVSTAFPTIGRPPTAAPPRDEFVPLLLLSDMPFVSLPSLRIIDESRYGVVEVDET